MMTERERRSPEAQKKALHVFEFGTARAVFYIDGKDVFAYPDGRRTHCITDGWLIPHDGGPATLYFGTPEERALLTLGEGVS